MRLVKENWVGLVVFGLLILVMWYGAGNGILNAYYVLNLKYIGINIILAVSLHLINGITGQFSIGHAGFMAIGAYTAAVASVKFQMPFLAALLTGGLIAAVMGLVVGLPTLRLKGDYLAIATLGFGEIIRISILSIDYVGGARGFIGVPMLTTLPWVYFWVLITILFVKNFVSSTHGRACVAIREDEIAAETMGINTTKYKVTAFVFGSLFAGIAGGLLAHNTAIVHPATFTFMKSIDILIMVVLGGLGSMTGAIMGAFMVTFISAALAGIPELRMVIYAAILILLMLYRPKGVMGTKEFSLGFGKKGGDGSGLASSH